MDHDNALIFYGPPFSCACHFAETTATQHDIAWVMEKMVRLRMDKESLQVDRYPLSSSSILYIMNE